MLKRSIEAWQGLIDGLHTYGCQQYRGEYGGCSCVFEIAEAAKRCDVVDLNDPVDTPVLPGSREMAFVVALNELHKMSCKKCGQTLSWGQDGVIDLLSGECKTQCKCGFHYKLARTGVTVVWSERPFEPPAPEVLTQLPFQEPPESP